MAHGYRAQRLDAGALDARARPRADLHALDDVDRRDLAEEVGELGSSYNVARYTRVASSAQQIHRVAPLRIDMLGRNHPAA
jgi:hypothetical protein